MAFDPVLNLADLNGDNGFVINGVDGDDFSGGSVSGAGDINGDGVDDLIIGASGADPNGENSGESYVVFGGAGGFSSSLELSSLNGDNGFVINGVDGGDISGGSVSGAGDINGDGVDDLIIGAFRADPNGDYSGESYVVFGSTTGFSSSLELSSLNGDNGFVINGVDARDYSGFSVSGAGDINGDGVDDLIIGAFRADPNGDYSGESYVVFGSTTGFSSSLELSSLNGDNGFVINGVDARDYSGFSVSGAGDINGDGVDDLIIGAFRADPNGDYSGESYVVFGGAAGFSSSLELSSLTGDNGFVINGVDGGDRSGYSVSGAGDINGDGVDDLIIGAYRASPNGDFSGESYVVFGGAGGFSSSLELSSLTGDNGFVIKGVDADDRSGRSVSGAGDINGDGVDDLIIGANRASPNGDFSGESYVVFGSAAGFSSSLELSSLTGDNGFVINGVDDRDRSGDSVSGAGDINGDGVDDLIIGAFGADPNGDFSGESYVVFGRPQATQATDDLITTNEDTTLSGNVLADNNLGADEGTNLTITLINETPFIGLPIPLASGAQLTLNSDGAFTYNPNDSFDALDVGDTRTDQFTYTLVGADGVTDTATAFILINGVNDSPIAAHDAFFVDENTRFVGNLFLDDPFGQDSDPEGHPLTLDTTPVSGPSNGDLVLLPNGGFAYTPNANFSGADSFEYAISDGNGGNDTATVTLFVLGQNDAPVAENDTATTDEATAFTTGNVLGNDSDPDGDPLTVSDLDTTNTLGTVTSNSDGTFDYDPNGQFDDLSAGETATDRFTYTVSDGKGGTDTATVTINILGQTDANNDDLLFSLNSQTTLDGLTLTPQDIVQYDGANFTRFFDGSDVLTTGGGDDDDDDNGDIHINAFDVISDTEILLSFNEEINLSGVGEVKSSDVVLFTATSLGETTSGSFSRYFDGSDVGLSSESEAIDGLTGLADGSLLISTTGNLNASGFQAADEDVIRFTPTSTGETTAGDFSRYIDGSDIGLTSEDVDALSIDAGEDNLFFSTTNNFAVTGLSGANEDVFGFEPASTGQTTSGSFASSLYFDGSDFGLSNRDIKGLDLTFSPVV